jgi:hydroxymethylpyrimidine/phosphomethylpyrimidine kinase
MGNVLPDRFFWALPGDEEGGEGEEEPEGGEGDEDEGAPDPTASGDGDTGGTPKSPRHIH